MKSINKCNTKEEIIEWADEKKRNLDKQLVYLMESFHVELGDIETKAKQRLKYLDDKKIMNGGEPHWEEKKVEKTMDFSDEEIKAFKERGKPH